MMRRVVCDGDCSQFWKEAIGKYPGEVVKIVRGTIHIAADCICDTCNAPLHPGSAANCVSVSTDMAPYFDWEDEFLAVDGRTIFDDDSKGGRDG